MAKNPKTCASTQAEGEAAARPHALRAGLAAQGRRQAQTPPFHVKPTEGELPCSATSAATVASIRS